MNYFQISLIALGLSLNLLTSAVAGGVVLRSSATGRKMLYLCVMILFQALTLAAGLLLGNRIGLVSENHNAIIALSILLIIGIKVLLDSIRSKPESKSFDINDNQVLIMVALAEAFTPLAVGIAIGLMAAGIFSSWLVLLLFQVLAIITGLVAGSFMGEQAFKLRLGPIGGLILLAAAMKLIINVIGF